MAARASKPTVAASPSTSAVALDAVFYPHIMEQIVAYAPYPVLLSFRATSSTYKKLADKRLLHHICFVQWITGSPVNEVLWTPDFGRLPMLRPFDDSYDGYDYYDDDSDDDFEKSQHGEPMPKTPFAVKVLDIITRIDYGDVDFLTPILRIDTVRTHERGNSAIGLLDTLPVRRHIHFTNIALSTGEEELFVPETTKKLVLNIQYDERYRRWTNDYIVTCPQLSTIEELVVIFDYGRLSDTLAVDAEPDADGEESSGTTDDGEEEIWELGAGAMWPFVLLSLKLWKSGSAHRLTIVNFPPPEDIHPCRFNTSWTRRFDAATRTADFQDGLREAAQEDICWQNQEERFDRTVSLDKIRQHIDNIEFLDRDTYRQRIGEEEFQLEIDRSAFHAWYAIFPYAWPSPHAQRR